MCDVLVSPVSVWIIHILNYANLVHQMFCLVKNTFLMNSAQDGQEMRKPFYLTDKY